MKTLFAGPCLTLLLIFTATVSQAQTNTFPSSGNVGIGTVSPSSELEVKSGSNNDAEIHINAMTDGDQSIIRFQDAGVNTWGVLSNYPTAGKFSLYNYQNGSNALVLDSNGNVGIGISSSNYRLHVVGTERSRFEQTDGTIDLVAYGSSGNDYNNIAGLYVENKTALVMTGLAGTGDIRFVTKPSVFTEQMVIKSNGNVGIGIKSPNYRFHVKGSERSRFEQTNGTIDLVAYGTSGNDFDNTAGLYVENRTALVMTGLIGTGDIRFVTRPSGYSERMVIKSNGNVGVGTTNPSNKLDVAGTIRGEEVEVEAAPWPDYVFSDTYELSDLSEVSDYIEENGHLPNIPSAEEVEENGIKLGEMNAKLLEKIEELTLYVIELKKENEQQNQKIKKLENR